VSGPIYVAEHDVPQAWLVEHAFRPPPVTACFPRSYFNSLLLASYTTGVFWQSDGQLVSHYSV